MRLFIAETCEKFGCASWLELGMETGVAEKGSLACGCMDNIVICDLC